MGTSATLIAIEGGAKLALIIEGVVAPVIIGAVKEIRALLNINREVEYTVVLSEGATNLASAVADFTDSLMMINKERASSGLPPLPVPPPAD